MGCLRIHVSCREFNLAPWIVADYSLASRCRNVQGQACVSGSRVYVHEAIYDKFMDAFLGFVKAARVGDPFSPANFYGPQVSKRQYEVRIDLKPSSYSSY